jgi:hypothetical protein
MGGSGFVMRDINIQPDECLDLPWGPNVDGRAILMGGCPLGLPVRSHRHLFAVFRRFLLLHYGLAYLEGRPRRNLTFVPVALRSLLRESHRRTKKDGDQQEQIQDSQGCNMQRPFPVLMPFCRNSFAASPIRHSVPYSRRQSVCPRLRASDAGPFFLSIPLAVKVGNVALPPPLSSQGTLFNSLNEQSAVRVGG